LESGVALTLESKKDKPFTSTPIALQPSKRASTSVVPEPKKDKNQLFFAVFKYFLQKILTFIAIFSIFMVNNPLVQASAAQRLKYDAGCFSFIG